MSLRQMIHSLGFSFVEIGGAPINQTLIILLAQRQVFGKEKEPCLAGAVEPCPPSAACY